MSSTDLVRIPFGRLRLPPLSGRGEIRDFFFEATDDDRDEESVTSIADDDRDVDLLVIPPKFWVIVNFVVLFLGIFVN